MRGAKLLFEILSDIGSEKRVDERIAIVVDAEEVEGKLQTLIDILQLVSRVPAVQEGNTSPR